MADSAQPPPTPSAPPQPEALWQRYGAHATPDGTRFRVWAPRARAVALIGDFNGWNAGAHPMLRDGEEWAITVPGVAPGARYKYAVTGVHGQTVDKADPYARQAEGPPGNASVVTSWPGTAPASPARGQAFAAPMCIYEVHAGSWRRPDGRLPDWDELAEQLIPYAVDMGFTHLELMPVAAHPFHGSWGYQPTALFAPEPRHGSPEALSRFVARAHAAGLKVLLDWVPGHFPSDAHGLARFDGEALYEYADWREGVHRDWNTLIYNFAHPAVRRFLVDNALFWLEAVGMDGLRVDAVASMLYRDYSRGDGQWLPNRHGGRENLEAAQLLREVNAAVHARVPGAVLIAEESTAFPGVTEQHAPHGLGFDFKWNMGWMHDTLAYFALDPVYRRWHHGSITFALSYAFGERYVLPLSHDEVVHGKGSLLTKMWGGTWDKHAQLRALAALMYGLPGKKLMFMGMEIATPREWNHDGELDWWLLEHAPHAGMQRLVRDLNLRLRETPALYERDHDSGGFCWVDVNNPAESVFSFLRLDFHGGPLLVVANLTTVERSGVPVGVPRAGEWVEVINTDSAHYGGANRGNLGRQRAEGAAIHGQPCLLRLGLPPLSVLWLAPWREGA